jgi:hypothetical protein
LHVEIDVLKTKNVLLFISDLDISDADISILRLISDKIGKEDHYKIVWIPFMEEWTKDQKDKFENSQSNMLWYTGYIARYNLKKASCRFIKEQWHFKGKPLLVVLNSQGQVECENAMHMIRVYGVESFPFTRGAEETLLKEKCWIEFVIIHIKKEIPRWVRSFHKSNACAHTHILPVAILGLPIKFLGAPKIQRLVILFSHINGGSHYEFNW